MNLLLLLSALFSALTGATAAVRSPAAAHAAQSVVAAAANVAKAVPAAGVRPAASLPTLALSALASAQAPALLPATVPLYASRRRE